MRLTAGLVSIVTLVLAVAPGEAQQTRWVDPSPHSVTLINVEDDVRLEVLGWGGTGPAVVLLAGLGLTAHVFDEFAPELVREP